LSASSELLASSGTLTFHSAPAEVEAYFESDGRHTDFKIALTEIADTVEDVLTGDEPADLAPFVGDSDDMDQGEPLFAGGLGSIITPTLNDFGRGGLLDFT
jgi:hypothetical protein